MLRVKNRLKKYCLPIILFVFTVVLYGPFSIYLPNAEELWFTLPMFASVVLLVSAALLVVLLLCSIAIPETKHHILIKLFFGITLGMYIQGTFMNISYGSGVQDGSEIVWSDYTMYAIINTVVWIICIAIPFIVDKIVKGKAKMFYSILAYVSAFLIAIQVPAFASQLMSSKQGQNSDFTITSDNMFEVSDKDNILVFVLDTMDEKYYEAFIDTHPDYVDNLTGFVHYSNSSAAGCRTFIGIPAMFTGTPFTRSNTYTEYLQDVWSKPNAFSVLNDAGYKVSVYSETMVFSPSAIDYIDNFHSGGSTVGSQTVFAKKIYKMDMYKFMPHLLKKFFWYDSSEFDEAKAVSQGNSEQYELNDPYFYEQFHQKGWTVDSSLSKVTQVYHLYGAHSSFKMNEFGEKASGVTREQQVAGSFYQLNLMLEELKSKNLYDISTIIITTDHGDLNEGQYSMFLLKPKGANEKYRTTAAPVSHFDIPGYLAALAGKSLDNPYGEELTGLTENTERERHFFYNTSGSSRVRINEYITTGAAGDHSSWKLYKKHTDSTSADTEYVLGTPLSFMTDATANVYTVEGFGNNTGFQTKLHGPVSSMKIPIKGINQLPSDSSLLARIEFYYAKASLNQSLTIVANGVTVFEGKTSADILRNGLEFKIPVSSFQKNNNLVLELHFTDIPDDELELSVKKRTQTLGLLSLVINKE